MKESNYDILTASVLQNIETAATVTKEQYDAIAKKGARTLYVIMDDEEVTDGEVVDYGGLYLRVGLGREGRVHGAPGNLVMNVWRIDDIAVLGRAASVAAGIDGKGSRGGKVTLVGVQRLLHQDCGRGVHQNGALIATHTTSGKLILNHMSPK